MSLDTFTYNDEEFKVQFPFDKKRIQDCFGPIEIIDSMVVSIIEDRYGSHKDRFPLSYDILLAFAKITTLNICNLTAKEPLHALNNQDNSFTQPVIMLNDFRDDLIDQIGEYINDTTVASFSLEEFYIHKNNALMLYNEYDSAHTRTCPAKKFALSKIKIFAPIYISKTRDKILNFFSK